MHREASSSIHSKQLTIKYLQMDLRRRLEFLDIFPLSVALAYYTSSRGVVLGVGSFMCEIYDLIAQNFTVACNDIQRTEVAERAL